MNQEKLAYLQKKLESEKQNNYPCTSRVHPLRSFWGSTTCYVKREDELGFGISGSKFRKYRTLIPFLKDYLEVIVLGGPFSNHVLGITQLLIENQIRPTLFLKGRMPIQSVGNFFFLQKLISPSSIHWISNRDWPLVHEIAQEYANERDHAFILPEAAAIFPSFLGALTLPLDIVRNEKEMNFHFDHVFTDAGSGWQAAALLLAFSFIEKITHHHILLVAGTKNEFLNTLQTLHAEFESWLGMDCPFPHQYECTFPSSAKSFGSTNSALFQFIFGFAKQEGFFLDPIYSGKLFFHAKEQLQHESFKGNTLLIHSGGALSLSGF